MKRRLLDCHPHLVAVGGVSRLVVGRLLLQLILCERRMEIFLALLVREELEVANSDRNLVGNDAGEAVDDDRPPVLAGEP